MSKYDEDMATSAGDDNHLPMIDGRTRDSMKLPKKMRRGMSLNNSDLLTGMGKEKKIPTM